jgi:calcineurin-like phosphoesterase family protein
MMFDFRPKNVWLTADHHFFHNGILHPQHGSSRASRWSTPEEMHAALLDQWRHTVGPHDVVYSVGDLFFRIGRARTLELLRALSGFRIVLLCGNHDGERLEKLARQQALPDNVQVVPRSESFVALGEYRRAVMSHWHTERWPGRERGTVLVHGHSHGKRKVEPDRLDVGWDVYGRLLHLEEVRAYFERGERPK